MHVRLVMQHVQYDTARQWREVAATSVWLCGLSDVGLAADVMVREYKEGVLLREDAITVEQLNSIFRPVKAAYRKKRGIRKQRTKVLPA